MLAEAALLAVLSVEHGAGAESCLGQARLERSVERRLKRRVFVPDADADLRLRVRFVQRGEQIEAHIEIASKDGTPRGSRSLVTSGHCSKLDDSLALSLALLVDQPPDPEPAPPPEAEAAAAVPIVAPVTPPPRGVIVIPAEVAAPREPWHVAAGAAAKAIWGALPGIAGGAVLWLQLRPGGFPAILLAGEGFLPAEAERDADSGARFRLVRVGLAICPALTAAPGASIGLCVGQQVAWLAASGYGFDHDAKQRRLGYSFSLGGEGRVRLFSPVSVRAFFGAEVPLLRDRFTSAGTSAQELFRVAPVAVAAEIGLEASLW